MSRRRGVPGLLGAAGNHRPAARCCWWMLLAGFPYAGIHAYVSVMLTPIDKPLTRGCNAYLKNFLKIEACPPLAFSCLLEKPKKKKIKEKEETTEGRKERKKDRRACLKCAGVVCPTGTYLRPRLVGLRREVVPAGRLLGRSL